MGRAVRVCVALLWRRWMNQHSINAKVRRARACRGKLEASPCLPSESRHQTRCNELGPARSLFQRLKLPRVANLVQTAAKTRVIPAFRRKIEHFRQKKRATGKSDALIFHITIRKLRRVSRLRLFFIGVNVKRTRCAIDHFIGDNHLLDALKSGKLIHGIEQNGFHDGP